MGINAVAPDGSLYSIADYGIRRIAANLPGFSLGDFRIPSEDGSEVYQFDSAGRHLKTLNALTGSLIYQFAYDAAGRLSSVTDTFDNLTRIERDNMVKPTAIIAPFGQRTTLALDANGHLSTATNPAGESYRMTYTAEGLLTALTDPRGNTSTMSYDGARRLLIDTNAAGGSQSLEKSALADGHEVRRTTILGRSITHRVENLGTGDQRRTGIGSDGIQTVTVTVNGTNSISTTTLADGTVRTLTQSGDPRFQMLAPIPASQTLSTGGKTSTVTMARSVTLADPANPLNLSRLNDTVTINNRTSTRDYDAATKTATTISPAGHRSTETLDNFGRIVQAQVPGL